MKRFIAIIAAACLLALLAVPALASGSGSLDGTQRATSDPVVRSQIQEKLASLRDADAQAKALMQSLKDQRATNQSLLQSLRDSVKSLRPTATLPRTEVQAKRESVKMVVEQLRALREQGQPIMAGVKSLREQAAAVRAEVKAARQAKDVSGVLAGLDRLTDLSQQTINLLQQLSNIEGRVGGTLSSVK